MPGLISLGFQGRCYKTEHPVLIIFITGHVDLTMGVCFMKKCALDFLANPIDNKLFIVAVEDSSEEESDQGYKLP
ncbi:MAG: hypothetical protein HGJ94_02875 [Desulfosarcina sp.]|nr:hypothetical protein [Desulfosarcina sp.]